jgi:hypothetical protein
LRDGAVLRVDVEHGNILLLLSFLSTLGMGSGVGGVVQLLPLLPLLALDFLLTIALRAFLTL